MTRDMHGRRAEAGTAPHQELMEAAAARLEREVTAAVASLRRQASRLWAEPAPSAAE